MSQDSKARDEQETRNYNVIKAYLDEHHERELDIAWSTATPLHYEDEDGHHCFGYLRKMTSKELQLGVGTDKVPLNFVPATGWDMKRPATHLIEPGSAVPAGCMIGPRGSGIFRGYANKQEFVDKMRFIGAIKPDLPNPATHWTSSRKPKRIKEPILSEAEKSGEYDRRVFPSIVTDAQEAAFLATHELAPGSATEWVPKKRDVQNDKSSE